MMQHLISAWLDWTEVLNLYQPEAALYLLLVLLLLGVGQVSFARTMRLRLRHELASTDNKAVAVSLAGYVFGLAFVLWGLVTADGLHHLGADLVDLGLNGLVGVCLLNFGRFFTDRVVFPGFSTREAILRGNLAVGLVEAGNYLGTGLIVMRALSLDGFTNLERWLDAGVFFLAAQAAFALFGALYQRLTRFDLQQQVRDGNAAAGVGLGMTCVAQGVLLSYAIHQTASLIAFAVWFLGSTVLLLGLRALVDRVLLSGHDLDDEISRDQNWGAALLEGTMALSTALLLTGLF